MICLCEHSLHNVYPVAARQDTWTSLSYQKKVRKSMLQKMVFIGTKALGKKI